MNFNETKAFLMEAGFTPKQWRELGAICEIRQGNYTAVQSRRGAEMEDVQVDEEHVRLFYERLTNILLNQEKLGVAPLNVLRKAQPAIYANVKKVASYLYKLSAEWNEEGDRQRNFSIGVYHLYAQLVVAYLKDCRVPISAKAVLQHQDKFIGLVDRAYPGYVEGGLMRLIVLGEAAPDYVSA